MLLTKLSNFVSRIVIIIIYFCLLFSNLNAEESIDIWKKQKSTTTKKNDIVDKKESPKINILEKNNSNQKITIIGKINNGYKKNSIIFDNKPLNLSKFKGYSHKF